jgi:peptidoglycan/xylan/chitin deacetylase (PgdA/CDA1 family)
MTRGVVILAYHRVLESPDPLRTGDIQAACFEKQMQTVKRFFNVLPLRSAIEKMKNGDLPARAVSITFDDGYADNYRIAWPVLRRLNLPATIFVATGFLDGGRMWNDTVIEYVRCVADQVLDLEDMGLGRHAVANNVQRSRAAERILGKLKYLSTGERDRLTAALAGRAGTTLPDDLMLTSDQVREMSKAGIEIGAHTISHPILKTLDPDSASTEIIMGKKKLEGITGTAVRSFAYPNGKPGLDFDPVHVQLVKDAGFDCAVATSDGLARQSSDVFQLPRFGVWAESPIRFGLRILRMHLIL